MKQINYIYLLYPVLAALVLAWAVTGWITLKASSQSPKVYNTSVSDKKTEERLPDTGMILEQNVFKVMASDQEVATPSVSASSAGKTSSATSDSGFDGKLIGTASGDEESIAVIEYKNKKYILNMLEEQDGLLLVELGSFYAIISKDNQRYRLVLTEEGKNKASKSAAVKVQDSAGPATQRMKISRKEVVEKLSDVNSVIKSVLIVPFERNGNFEGYRVRRMTNTSVLKQIGVERNDVIMRLNGKSLESPSVFFDALKNAENLSAVTLDILRSGKKMTLYVEIEG